MSFRRASSADFRNRSFILRPVTPDDAEWVFSEIPRLHEFGPPPWRTVEQMNAGERVDIGAGLDKRDAGDRLFLIAERTTDGVRLGFVYATTLVDFFTAENHGHISDVVVTREAEGQGVGRALMDAAEAWGRERGYRLMTLGVFPQNQRALMLYERLGYRTDVIRMLKVLDTQEVRE
jgi:ribosomal protein S18 acetylase RimI-like enzyme